jgi:hypothetical protein
MVFVTSPQGAHDVLDRTDAVADRAEKPIAVQPMVAKQHLPRFARHIAKAAQEVCRGWGDDDVDLDTQCRKLTLRALGRSVARYWVSISTSEPTKWDRPCARRSSG